MNAVTVTPEPVLVDIVVTNQGQDDWYLQAATFPICSFHMWNMGDGTMYRTPDVVHSYLDLEEHWVTLNVRTIHGFSSRWVMPSRCHTKSPTKA